MLQENVSFLTKYNKNLLEEVREYELKLKSSSNRVIQTKSGDFTIQVLQNNSSVFIHSKYDPKKEAERLVSQYEEDINKYNHIILYGCGLGYHVEAFMNKYPDKDFVLYEPKPDIFYQYLCTRHLNKLPLKCIKNIYVEWSQEYGSRCLEILTSSVSEEVLLITLPSYERIFPKEIEFFSTTFKEKFQFKRSNLGADIVYSKRWTLNALMNLPHTLKSPNLLVDKKSYFKEKPVLLVSAGPSLEEEFENLREIKEKKLAYIFAVGSANKALIANDIIPDAVCTYDPQDGNFNVFKEMIENGNDNDIPMIYGTTVGFKTLEQYKGPKLFVPTSQDTVTSFFTMNDNIPKVDDAFSIAIVTLQILAKLEVKHAILVGQNFAFRNKQYYSSGISYGDVRSTEVQDRDLEEKVLVKDVNGNEVLTNSSFNQMRLLMEKYINKYPSLSCINTTKDGAAIKGAPYQSLKEVINIHLTKKVVVEDWFTSHNSKIEEARKQIEMFEVDVHFCRNAIEDFSKVLKELELNLKRENIKNIHKLYTEYDKTLKAIVNNNYYQMLLNPILKVETTQFDKSMKLILQVQEEKKRVRKIINESKKYIELCNQYFDDYYRLIRSKVYPKIFHDTRKFYSSLENKSIFSLKGTWIEKDEPVLKYTKIFLDYRSTSLYSNQRGSKIKFDFIGDKISLVCSVQKNFTSKLSITIDGKKELISTRALSNEPLLNEIVYEKKNLEKIRHKVEIELLEDREFVLEGILLSLTGRLLHTNEVMSIEEIGLRNRIRVYYDEDNNELLNYGKETTEFLEENNTNQKSGDMYIIGIEKDQDNNILVCKDRSIQKDKDFELLYKINNSVSKNNSGPQLEKTTYTLHSVVPRNKGWKKILHDTGFISYSKDWKVEELYKLGQKEVNYRISNIKGARANFCFIGTSIRVYAIKGQGFSGDIELVIDNQVKKISLKGNNENKEECVLELTGLENILHKVEVILSGNNSISLTAVEINAEGRFYHTDEVKNVRDLKVGKRIRCHYTAMYNNAGVFSGLGSATEELIPASSTSSPNGDFYFIMVEKGFNGRLMLIADRNVQHSISWSSLNQSNFIYGKQIELEGRDAFIRSLTGGLCYTGFNGEKSLHLVNTNYSAFPHDNEWDKYISDSSFFDDVNINLANSWCQDAPLQNLVHPRIKEIIAGRTG